MKAWRIKHWEEHFEKAGGHKPSTEVIYRWVAMPTKHDGKSFRRLARRSLEGERAFCAWNLMVQVAGKMPVRGLLADLDGPLTAEDLSDKTGFSSECFEIAFKVLSDQKIDWIEEVECPDLSGQGPELSRYTTGQDRTRQDRTEQETTGQDRSRPDKPAAAVKGEIKSSPENVRHLLAAEGFIAGDPLYENEFATEAQVRIAIDNANALEADGKMQRDGRRGYIASCIMGKYRLSRSAADARKKAEDRKRSIEEEKKSKAEIDKRNSEAAELQRIAQATVKELDPQERIALRDEVVNALPEATKKLFCKKDPLGADAAGKFLQLRIYELLQSRVTA